MNLQFDFTVDKATNTIHVTREFAADLDTVWDAWTKAEMLENWWAPKPWRARTKEMNFREGGHWLYAMLSPENVPHWSLVEYISIQPKSAYSSKNSFCDENGTPVSAGLPLSIWNNSFKAGADTTIVDIIIKMENLAGLEQFIAMGFKEGFTMGLGNLDEYLRTLAAGK